MLGFVYLIDIGKGNIKFIMQYRKNTLPKIYKRLLNRIKLKIEIVQRENHSKNLVLLWKKFLEKGKKNQNIIQKKSQKVQKSRSRTPFSRVIYPLSRLCYRKMIYKDFKLLYSFYYITNWNCLEEYPTLDSERSSKNIKIEIIKFSILYLWRYVQKWNLSEYFRSASFKLLPKKW